MQLQRRMKIIDNTLLNNLSHKALGNPRLRQNFNLHESLEDKCHRLLNAMEPASYIQPHRHSDYNQQEGFVALRGRLAALTFDENGKVQDIAIFGLHEMIIGVDIPADVWHTVISLEPRSVFYEVKAGPYHPIPKNDLAVWAPVAGSKEAHIYLALLQKQVLTLKNLKHQ